MHKQTNKQCPRKKGGFASGPMVKTPCSQCRRPGLIPRQGTKSDMLQLRPSAN